MALVPIDQYKKTAPKKPSFGTLKPLAAKPVRAVQAAPRPDIRQSDVYKNAVANANRSAQEARDASSFKGMLKNSLKAAPRATADVLVGTPIKFAASVAEIPETVARGKYTDRTYKVPGLSPFKSLQSDYGDVEKDVIAGRKGMGSAAWSLAKIPLAGLETGVGASGIARGVKALAAGNVKNAGAIVSDAFLPTNFSTRAASRTGLAPLPARSPQPETPTIGQAVRPIQKTVSPEAVPPTISPRSVVGSYTEGLPPKTSGVNNPETLSKAADKIINPMKPKANERGFIETVRNSPEISQDIAKKVEGTYDTRHNIPAQKRAQRLIFENINEAERIAKGGGSDDAVFTANELVKHWDGIAQNAKAAGNEAEFQVAMDKAIEIAQESSKNLTEAGRTVQAASTINRLSPDGIIQYVNKAIRDVGGDGVKLSNEKYFDIVRKAEMIKDMADPRQRALATFDLIDDIYSDIPQSTQYKVGQALNLPRAIMSTADLSAPLRQGIFTMARNPKTFAKNFGKMFKYAFSEDAYRNLKADIITSPNYSLYVKHNLPITDLSQALTGREEQFMSNLAEKIPVFGKIAKGSNRAYAGFLNKMRVDLFDDFVKTAELNGIDDPKFFDDAAKFVGSATGRGDLGRLEDHAVALNSIFFSPRLMASRLNLINPAYYVKLHPTVRAEALKSLAAFVGTGMSILGLSKLAGAEVGTDPRSADFGKMKFGNTRYDTWGGFQQYARLIGQLTTGEMVSTVTGKETQLGEGYNAPTRLDIIARFLSSKENPIASFVTSGLSGKTGLGEDFNLPAEVIDRFIPMLSNDVYDLMREYGPKGALMAVPGSFGVGSQTYSNQIPMLSETASGAPSVKWRQQPGVGETVWNAATGKDVSNIPEEQWEALANERKEEQKRQAEVQKVKAIVLITGEPQYVGDTKIYLENGVVKTKKESKDKRLPLKDQLLYEELQKRKTDPFYKN